ncbi:murein biosynthesis integral membrane protein MurJ [Buchnera aphidicola (Ceratoglyphina bambusae)]|uniref:murein biosynthesis integral membrane protein MurJ n=1 Tax=Buchnera aphidicola TaxID=9 RepID=UPI0031B847BD
MAFLKSILSISIISFLSRFIGFIRDIYIAECFGVSMYTDAFFIAFKIPNFFRKILSDGAFSQVFLPILIKLKKKKTKKEVNNFISNIFGLIILLLLLVIFLGVVFSSKIILLIAPGFCENNYKYDLTVFLLQIIFPYIFFICMVSLSACVLNAWNHFLSSSVMPVFLNFSMIIFSMFFSSYFNPPILSLGISVLVGGFIQIILQIFNLYRIKKLFFPTFNFMNKSIYTFLNKIFPAMLGVSANQISLLCNTIISSLIISGSVSWIYYADRIIEFPAGILGTSLSTILLPYLSNFFYKNSKNKFFILFDWGIKLSLIISIPSALFVGFFSKYIIFTLFQYGSFTELDTLMTQKTLIAYSIGLISMVLTKVLVSAFYAQQDTSTPMKISIFSIIAAQIMNIFLVHKLQHVGLALSFSIGSWVNLFFLFYYLLKNKIFFLKKNWCKFSFSIFFSILFMILTMYFINNVFSNLYVNNNMLERSLYLIFFFFVSFISYFVSLFIFGFNFFKFYKVIKEIKYT